MSQFTNITRRFLKIVPWFGLLFLVGCDFQSRQSTFDPKGPVAKEQLDLFYITVWVVLFLFVTVGSVLLYAVIRFREKKTDDPNFKPKQSHGNPAVELGLILASVVMLVIIAIPTLKGIWFTHDLPEDEASHLSSYYEGEISEGEEEDVLLVYVYGWQWWWSFEYPQLGVTTANELVIPKGKVVKLELRSKDVIHSFWLPKIAGKVDTIPGRINSMWIKADETGHYYGQCAEYCGESHAYMLFRTEVFDTEGFNAWVHHQQSGAKSPLREDTWDGFASDLKAFRKGDNSFEGNELAEGAAIFYTKGQCNTCHSVNGSNLALGTVAPDLTHVGSRKSIAAGWLDNRPEGSDEIDPKLQLENFKRWVGHPDEVKPGNLMYAGTNGMTGLNQIELTDEEVRKLALYLQSLK